MSFLSWDDYDDLCHGIQWIDSSKKPVYCDDGEASVTVFVRCEELPSGYGCGFYVPRLDQWHIMGDIVLDGDGDYVIEWCYSDSDYDGFYEAIEVNVH